MKKSHVWTPVLMMMFLLIFCAAGCKSTPPTDDPNQPKPAPSATESVKSPTDKPTETVKSPDTEKAEAPKEEEKKLTFEEALKMTKRVEPAPVDQQTAKIKLSAKYLKTDEPIPLDNVADSCGLALVDKDIVIIPTKDILTAYKLQNGTLKIAEDWFEKGTLKIPFRIGMISTDKNGLIYVSSGVIKMVTVTKKGIEAVNDKHDCQGYYFTHPSGNLGASIFVASDLKKFKHEEGIFTADKWFLYDLTKKTRHGKYQNLDYLHFTENVIYVSGTAEKEIPTSKDSQEMKKTTQKVITAYDFDGKEKLVIESPWEDPFADSRIGWVHGILESKHGIIILDSNMRDLVFFQKDATYIGRIPLKKLCGVDFIWPRGMVRYDADTIILLGYVKRPDSPKGKSVYELMAFEIKGL